MLVSQAIDQYLTHEAHRLALGIIKGPSLDRAREFALRAQQFLPEQLVSELGPADFRELMARASERWGCLRLRHLRVWVRSWLKFLVEEGHISQAPRTGTMQSPPYRPKPKHVYSPAELRTMLEHPRPIVGAVCGLGLWAGMNCGDVTALEPEHFDGHWVSQPRQKTGAARLAYVPSWVMAQLAETGIPIRSKYGTLKRRSVSTMWRDETQKLLGKPLPFTGLRTTLRSVVGHLDPEAVELSIMGLSASPLAGTPVAIKHYMSRDSISRERLRAVSKALTEYVQSS